MLDGWSIAGSHGSSTSRPFVELLAQVTVRQQHGATLAVGWVGAVRPRCSTGRAQLEQRRRAQPEHPRHGLLDAHRPPARRTARRAPRAWPRGPAGPCRITRRAEDAADRVARLRDVGPVDQHGRRAEPGRVGDQLGVVGDQHGARRDQADELGERQVADDGGAVVLASG